MRNLITAQEVIDLAFAENSNMMAESISDTAIRIAEIKYIRPAFGVMYPLLADKYAEFTNDYVKPALAYFVKCEIVSSIAIDMSNSGVAVANPQYQSAATDKQRQRLYDSEMSKAKTLLDFALEYIATHSEEFPDFSGEAPKKHHRVGGILLGGGTSRSQSASIAGEAFKNEIERLSKDVAGKVDKVEGKGLSTNDFTDEYKKKVDEFSGGGGSGSITIDKELSATSDNAIANSAVVKGLAGIAEGVSEAIGNVAKNVEQNTADIKTKQDTLTLTTKPNGNIVIGNLAGQSKEFMPATPSGDPMHYAYIENGAVYNASTGFWELNGINDITPNEIKTIYNERYNAVGPSSFSVHWRNSRMRTNMCNCRWGMAQPASIAFGGADLMEVITLAYRNMEAFPTSTDNLFRNCYKLREVVTDCYMGYVTSVTDMFYHCSALEKVHLKQLQKDISFANSPLLSKESLLYMISNCASNATFTITLHPDVYAKCTRVDEGEGQYIGEWWDEIDDALGGAVESKNTNITLASA